MCQSILCDEGVTEDDSNIQILDLASLNKQDRQRPRRMHFVLSANTAEAVALAKEELQFAGAGGTRRGESAIPNRPDFPDDQGTFLNLDRTAQ